VNGSSLPLQILYRRKAAVCPPGGWLCSGSVRDSSFFRNASGTFLGAVTDTTAVPPISFPPARVGRAADWGSINIGSVAGAPAGNYHHPSWVSAVNAVVAGSASLAEVGGASIAVAAGETIGLWFIWMDGTRSYRSIDDVVPGMAGVWAGGAGDPSTNLASDGHIRLSYAMQARSWMNANWNNTRPWTGAVRYTIDPGPSAAAAPTCAAGRGKGGAVAAAVVGWLLAAAMGLLLARARAAGGRRGDVEGVGLVEK